MKNAIPKKPFERDGSYIFFKAVKYGNYQIVNKMLEFCKYYVLDFDSVY